MTSLARPRHPKANSPPSAPDTPTPAGSQTTAPSSVGAMVVMAGPRPPPRRIRLRQRRDPPHLRGHHRRLRRLLRLGSCWPSQATPRRIRLRQRRVRPHLRGHNRRLRRLLGPTSQGLDHVAGRLTHFLPHPNPLPPTVRPGREGVESNDVGCRKRDASLAGAPSPLRPGRTGKGRVGQAGPRPAWTNNGRGSARLTPQISET